MTVEIIFCHNFMFKCVWRYVKRIQFSVCAQSETRLSVCVLHVCVAVGIENSTQVMNRVPLGRKYISHYKKVTQ